MSYGRDLDFSCGSASHFTRRTLLKAAGTSGALWLTPLAEALARQADKNPTDKRPHSVIVLWLAGGPSQLETFDPHPDSAIAGGTEAIPTKAAGIQLAKGYEQLADVMDDVALVRSVVTKEGDHERATYNVKTGFRPDPTLVHPALGAIIANQLPDNVEIPRHISILPDAWPARGGYLGDQFDAFKVDNPGSRIPDMVAQVPKPRFDRRIQDLLGVVDKEFSRGRIAKLDTEKTLHGVSIQAALKMMSSDQLKAFDLTSEPAAVKNAFGDTSFGRGCLTALRLIEVGVRCVEVTLGGWDSHTNNHDIHHRQAGILDPAFASLLRELKRRELLERTIVLCGGEFGRTPSINPTGGRDHWPHGFTIALAGGGVRGGTVVGETTTEQLTEDDAKDVAKHVKEPHNIADIHATVLHALGIDFQKQLDTPIGRPMFISEGKVIESLIG